MVFEIHLAIEGDSDHFELSCLPKVVHAEFNFKESANLGKIIELHPDSLAELDKFGLSQSLTTLKVLRDCCASCIHEYFYNLQKLLLENHMLVFRKDVENVLN